MFKYNLSNKFESVSSEMCVVDLITETESLNSAYAELSDIQRHMNEVEQIMDNVHTSLELISKFGDGAIAPLNIDKGLELLLGIPEKLITAEKAQEGLGSALVEGFKKFASAVIAFFKKIFSIFSTKVETSKAVAENVNAAKKEVEKAPEKEKEDLLNKELPYRVFRKSKVIDLSTLLSHFSNITSTYIDLIKDIIKSKNLDSLISASDKANKTFENHTKLFGLLGIHCVFHSVGFKKEKEGVHIDTMKLHDVVANMRESGVSLKGMGWNSVDEYLDNVAVYNNTCYNYYRSSYEKFDSLTREVDRELKYTTEYARAAYSLTDSPYRTPFDKDKDPVLIDYEIGGALFKKKKYQVAMTFCRFILTVFVHIEYTGKAMGESAIEIAKYLKRNPGNVEKW